MNAENPKNCSTIENSRYNVKYKLHVVKKRSGNLKKEMARIDITSSLIARLRYGNFKEINKY